MAGAEELRALVARAGGRQRVLLVGEARAGEPSARALLEGFARALLGEAGAGPAGALPEPGPGRRLPACALLLVLLRARSLLLLPREPRRLPEILRDVRGRLRPSRPAVVGVAVLGSGGPEPDPEPAQALRLLRALLRRAFPDGRPPHDALQAAAYLPGAAGAADQARVAACRALRAALQLQAGRAEVKKVQLPAFLQCVPWGKRSQRRKGHLGKAANNSNEDSLQDPEEGVALTNMALNAEL